MNAPENKTPENNAVETLLTDDHLRAQVKLLGTLLGQILLQFAGEDVYEAVETLRRGFVVVRGARDGLVTSRNDASRETALELEFHDGRLAVVAGGGATPPQSKPTPKRKPRSEKDQGSLF